MAPSPTAPLPLHFEPLRHTLTSFARAADVEVGALRERLLAATRHGDYARWLEAIERLPPVRARSLDLRAPAVLIGKEDECDAFFQKQIEATLSALVPWRKGPFSVYGIELDAEWRSDKKWARLEPHMAPLAGRRVLDVGCGNGYYCLRALGAGAEAALGIDPGVLFALQFEALRRLLPEVPAAVLPCRFEDLPSLPSGFDTVLSLGVLYHRRAPLEHLERLRRFVRPGGQLVLETLVVSDAFEPELKPAGRYANMANVWSIPTVRALRRWLGEAGFERSRVVDVTRTTSEEQRQTRWMPFHSLAQGLDPRDPERTIEGYPAPTRAVTIAE